MMTAGCFGEVKYIFYMIGDGMGANQVLAAEMYRAELQGRIGRVPLRMTSFPYTGYATTYSTSNSITDSPAGGTALACGVKTNNGGLAVDKDTTSVSSIAEEMHDAGWPVALITSVAIDHATPAAFYAHLQGRKRYYEIGKRLAHTGFEFFGGAGFHQPVDPPDTTAINLYDYCEQNGYTFAHGYKDAQAKLNAGKLIMVQADEGIDRTKSTDCLPYAIDRKEGDLTLAQITETALKYMESKEQFFMMIEGGMIDYSGHGRDGATNILETLDFDESIELVYQFYLAHPDETLIVVTADHETGGMSLGNGGKYILNLQLLQNQKTSSWELNNSLRGLYAELGKRVTWEQVKQLLQNTLGFYDQVPITDKEDAKLRAAHKRTLHGKQKDEKALYNDISEIGGLAIGIINKKAKLGWSGSSHTAANAPVFAIGVGAEKFTGWYENTEIVQKIREIINE